MKHILFLLFLCNAASLDAQCLYLPNCPNNFPVCDYTANDYTLWNETYWLDPVTQSNNLADAPCVATATVNDSCLGAVITAKYLLFLDLDNNGAWETIIKSWELPAPGTVNFNNVNNPNYDGGEPRTYDERPVPADQKYQFALETSAGNGTLTAQLRWNTTAAPNVFVPVELPYGTAKIQWIFEDNFGDSELCEYTLAVTDCKKPTVVCYNGLSVNIMPTQQITIWASDFLQYGEDNATPTPQLKYGIRRSNTGTGFPVDGNGDPILNVTFDCSELGTQIIELWAKDLAGNVDFCETYVIVQDNAGNCSGGGGNNDTPIVICLNGISVSLNPLGTVTVPASYLLHAVYDDVTPPNLIDLGIRRSNSGTGFPVDGQGNPIQSLVFEEIELGVNSVEIWARDEDGNADYCETYLIVQEYQGGGGDAPTIVCLNGLSINLLPTGLIQLFATDFLQYVQDDITPANQIVLGIRKTGTGTGFPVDGQGNPIQNVVYGCDEQGTQLIELWAKDQDGNADYCETYVVVQDNFDVCSSNPHNQTVCIKRWCDDAIVTNVSLSNNALVDSNGCYLLKNTNTITPSKNDDPNNGVTSLDLVKISRHILGLEPLTTYGMIASDINKSGSVTSFDIVEARKLIMGIYTEWPTNSSWRFVDAAQTFPNPNNPFQGLISEQITFPNFSVDSFYYSEFVAIKIGDVDCDGTPGVAAQPNDRQVNFLSIPDTRLVAGETIPVPVTFAEAGSWLAMQSGWLYDPQQIEIEAIIPGNLSGMEQSCFAEPTPGVLNMVWFSTQPQEVAAGEVAFTLQLRARQSLQLSQALQLARRTPETPRQLPAEGYDAQETPHDFQLIFRGHETHGTYNQTVIYQAQPNPTSAAATIPIMLTKPETVRVSISDRSGKLIWQDTRTLPSGTTMLDIPAQVFSEAGLYFWRVQAGETAASGKLIRI